MTPDPELILTALLVIGSMLWLGRLLRVGSHRLHLADVELADAFSILR